MSEPKKLSQRARTARHKAKHPEGEAVRKERQRQKEAVLRFHITRSHLYGYGIPTSVDQGSDIFKRVRAEYMQDCQTPVEVSHGD